MQVVCDIKKWVSLKNVYKKMWISPENRRNTAFLGGTVLEVDPLFAEK